MKSTFTACIWRGQELAFIEDFDRFLDAVQWARKMISIDHRAGYVNTSGNIAPAHAEQ